MKKLIFIVLLVLFFGRAIAQLPGYSYRKQITFDNTQVSGTTDLLNFPVLISFTDVDLRTTGNGGRLTNVNGFDIAFTSFDNCCPRLDHQLESYDPTTGQLLVWVNIPILDYNDDTDIYMYYGNSKITADQSSTSTWNANYEAVWHMGEDPGGAAPQTRDWTSGSNDGTSNGGMNSADLVSGKVGNAIDFDGNNDYINIGDVLIDGYTQLTLEAWIYPHTVGTAASPSGHNNNEGAIIHKAGSSDDNVGLTVSTGGLAFYTDDGSDNTLIATVPAINTWTHIAARWDGSTMEVYKNGLFSGSLGSVTNPIINNTNSLRLGGGHIVPNWFDGLLDEIRVSDVSRSSGWIATSFNNQNAPGSFYSVGSEEDVTSTTGPGGITSNLRLWLKSNSGTNTSTDESALSAWCDQSGNNNDAGQVSGSAQPAFRNNIAHNINFNPVVHFDGGSDNLLNASGILGSATYSDLNVYSAVVTDVVQNSSIFYEVCSPSRINIHAPWGNGNIYWDGGGTDASRRLSTAWGGTTETPYLWSNLYSTTSGQTVASQRQVINRNGLQIAQNNTGLSFTGTNNQFSVGSNGGANRHNGKIAEMVIYTGAIDATQHSKIESYLAIKYAITLDNSGGSTDGDYVDSNSATLWDADSHNGYHNDVIVIGRDDDSGLLQKQSHQLDDSLRIFIGAALAADNASNAGTISNDNSFIAIGHNGAKQRAQDVEMPAGVKSRFGREWKVTNTNFDDDFSLEIEWNNVDAGGFDITQIRLLVDTDDDFSDASIYGSPDVTFENGSIIVRGISTAEIPKGGISFITIASINRGVPLPIELILFDAKVTENNIVELNWQTASEINNDFFTIEKSKDAEIWNEVNTIDGAGNSSEKLSYKSVDDRPYSGISYYRLKQTDFDGKFTYSPIEVVTLSQLEKNEIKIYPNPGTGLMTIEGNKVELSEFALHNIYGQDVSSIITVTNQNSTSISIDISSLSNGIYTLRTKNNVRKLIKH